ncbi:MAG: amidase [Planctomycetaceae bacterium]|nr:amidase [Planctomycetaceae bacterium]
MPLNCTAALAGFAAGTLSPSELLEECLSTIERLEPQVHAWVRVDMDSARSLAAQLTAELRQNQRRGPLHGVPIGIKDIVDVAGVPTEAGSPWRRHHVAPADAPIVARLRAAGAVILGKTVTTEYASFDPPVTRNPWNLARTPGGSSSGSAASVASGMCPAAIGSQTGGSIVRPASFCGVAGFKPAWGTVPLAGIVPLSEHLDHPGPIARSVEDLRLIHQVIADHDAPTNWPAEWLAQPPQVRDTFDPERVPVVRIFEDFFLAEAAPDVRDATRAAVKKLAAAGASVQVVQLPASFADVHRNHRRLMARGAADAHGALYRKHPDQFGRHIGELIAEGFRVTDAEVTAALEHQAQFRHDLLAKISPLDVLITPSTMTVAPGVETTGDPRFNSPWSYSGLPTVSIPCGLADAGMPVSLQIAGKPWLVERLFAAATWCERTLAFNERPSLS